MYVVNKQNNNNNSYSTKFNCETPSQSSKVHKVQRSHHIVGHHPKATSAFLALIQLLDQCQDATGTSNAKFRYVVSWIERVDIVAEVGARGVLGDCGDGGDRAADRRGFGNGKMVAWLEKQRWLGSLISGDVDEERKVG